MELQEFIQNFASQFDEIEPSIFNKDTIFKNLNEWSSLIALSIIAMVDEEYDVRLKGDDIKTAETIEDLYVLVKNKK